MGASFSSTTYTPGGLLLDGETISRSITLLSGENRARGAVLGKITGSGKYKLSTAAAVDGSQVPDCILAEDTDASAADVATVAYFVCSADDSKIVLGSGHTAASIREGLRQKGIHLISVATTY